MHPAYFYYLNSRVSTPSYYDIAGLSPEIATYFTDQIWRVGNTLYTDYDFDALKDSITGNTAYVDPTAVGSSEAGTEANPYTSLSTAVANTSFTIYLLKVGARCRITADMTINRTIRFGTYGGDGYAEVASQIDLGSWTVNGTHANVYQASNASTALVISSAFDESNIDENVLFTGLTRQSSIANVAANANSFYYDADADIMYVRTFDDRMPDASIVPLVSSTLTRLFRFNANMGDLQNRSVYMENIKVYGGNPIVFTNTSVANYWNVGLYNCHFSYAGTKDGLLMAGYCQAFIKDCRSDYNEGDGFNYSNSVGFSFEWNCKSWFSRNGTSNNGSTSHLGWRIIRVSGDYQYHGGKPVQDINDTKALSINCVAGNSIATDPDDYAYATNSATGDQESWWIECQAVGDRGFRNFGTATGGTSTANIYDGDYGNLLTKENREDAGCVTNILTESEVYQ